MEKLEKIYQAEYVDVFMERGEIEGGDRYSYQQVPAERGTKKTRDQSPRKPDFLLVNTVFFDQRRRRRRSNL